MSSPVRPSVASRLFPRPSPSSASLCNLDSERHELITNILQENHTKFHVFYNKRKYHNHIPHHVLAIWALGGHQHAIRAAYELDARLQIPSFQSPHSITVENFGNHLGDDRFYCAYLDYFTNILEERGDIGAVLEECVFSPSAIEMFSRLMGGLMHPMIHVGNGCLAQAAVHPSITSAVIQIPSSIADSFTPLDKSTHAFTVLAHVVKDTSIRGGNQKIGFLGYNMYQWVMGQSGDVIYKHVGEWADFDTADPDVVARKVEELRWTSVLLYAVSSFQMGETMGFKADFFNVHLVSSSFFLPYVLQSLSPASKLTLLRTYLATCIAWWISRGKPRLDIGGFFASDIAELVPTAGKPTEAPFSTGVEMGSAWTAIITQAIEHPDDHLVKCQRALYHYSTLYGRRAPFHGTGLDDIDTPIDGSLFLRAAMLTAGRLAGARGDNSGNWDL